MPSSGVGLRRKRHSLGAYRRLFGRIARDGASTVQGELTFWTVTREICKRAEIGGLVALLLRTNIVIDLFVVASSCTVFY